MKKRASLLAVLLAASLSFSSVMPALAVEAPAGEVEAVEEQTETEMEAEAESESEVENDSAEEAESESTTDSESDVKSSEETEVGTESEDEEESGVEEDAKEEAETESVEEASEEAANEADQPAENDATASDETESGNTDPMEIVGPIIGESQMETYVPGDTDGQSSDDLFEAYVDKAFGGADSSKKLRGGGYAGAKLTGVNRAIGNSCDRQRRARIYIVRNRCRRNWHQEKLDRAGPGRRRNLCQWRHSAGGKRCFRKCDSAV